MIPWPINIFNLTLPNAALHGHVRGERSRRRQRKRWIDNAREDLEERGIQLSKAYGKTKHREVWRNMIRASSSASWWKRRKKKEKNTFQAKESFLRPLVNFLNIHKAIKSLASKIWILFCPTEKIPADAHRQLIQVSSFNWIWQRLLADTVSISDASFTMINCPKNGRSVGSQWHKVYVFKVQCLRTPQVHDILCSKWIVLWESLYSGSGVIHGNSSLLCHAAVMIVGFY